MNFYRMNPSSVYYNEKVKVSNLEYEKIKLDKNICYWNIYDPFIDDGIDQFKKFVSSNPIWRMNNEPELEDTNPFATIHLPTFATDTIFNLLRDFCKKELNIMIPLNVNDWGNLYFKDECRPIKRWRLPHMDYVGGIASNLWLTDHEKNLSGTKLYHYTGKTYGVAYDFQVDKEHRLYNQWNSYGARDRDDYWTNFSDDEAEYWGFIPVGVAPSKYNCMTCYLPNVSHAPLIDEKIDFRWSHTFSVFY